MSVRALVTAVLLSTLLATAASPAGELAWSTHTASSNCPSDSPPRTMRCTAQATSVPDGSATLDLTLSSLLQSYGPGLGYGSADAVFGTAYELAGPARSLTIHVRVRVNSASIEFVRRLGGLAPGAYGYIDAWIQTGANSCACYNSGGILIADSFEPTLSNTTLDFAVELTSYYPEGGPPIDGKVAIGGYLSASAGMGAPAVGFGSIHLSLDGQISIVGVDVVPV